MLTQLIFWIQGCERAKSTESWQRNHSTVCVDSKFPGGKSNITKYLFTSVYEKRSAVWFQAFSLYWVCQVWYSLGGWFCTLVYLLRNFLKILIWSHFKKQYSSSSNNCAVKMFTSSHWGWRGDSLLSTCLETERSGCTFIIL